MDRRREKNVCVCVSEIKQEREIERENERENESLEDNDFYYVYYVQMSLEYYYLRADCISNLLPFVDGKVILATDMNVYSIAKNKRSYGS